MFSHLEIFRETKKGVTIWGVTIMSRGSFCLLTTLVFVDYSKFLPSISLRQFLTLTIPHSTIHDFHKNLHFGKKSLTSAKKLHFVKKLHSDKKSSPRQKNFTLTKKLDTNKTPYLSELLVEVNLFCRSEAFSCRCEPLSK